MERPTTEPALLEDLSWQGCLALGFGLMAYSVIPLIPQDKKPLIEWKRYQKERASQQQIRDWWMRWPNANIGIVTGKISDILVMDIDVPEKEKEVLILANTCFIVRTGSGGYHLYYRYPAGQSYIPSRAGVAQGIDVRADGGYVVAPGSIHPNGGLYEWI